MTQLLLNSTPGDVCSGIADGPTLLDLARGWLKQGNPAVAEELLDAAVQSDEADRDPDLRAHVLKEIGRVKMMQSDWDQAESFHLEAQRVFVSVQNYKGAAQCARNRANTLFQAGKYTHAQELCRDALDWASTAEDYELRATILNTMGAIESAQGMAEQAVSTFRLCLADFRTAGNAIRQGYVLLNIGLAQTELRQFAQAQDSLNQALSIALTEKDQNLVEICYQNIAKCYLAQNEANLAKSVVDTARRILPGLNSKALEMELALIEALIARAQGDIKTSNKLLAEILPAVREHNLSGLVADVLFEQARSAREAGDLPCARSKARSAADQYRAIGATHGESEARELIEALG